MRESPPISFVADFPATLKADTVGTDDGRICLLVKLILFKIIFVAYEDAGLPQFWHVGYPSSAVPTQLLHSLPLHPLPYTSPLHSSAYVITPTVPAHLEPCHVCPTTTQTTSLTKSHTRPDRSLRPKRSAAKLPPSTTVEPGPAQSATGTTTQAQSHLPRSSYTFRCHKPGSTGTLVRHGQIRCSQHTRTHQI